MILDREIYLCYKREHDPYKMLDGTVGAEETKLFEATVIREKFDYTRWQQEFFDRNPPTEISLKAETFETENPYTGDAVRL